MKDYDNKYCVSTLSSCYYGNQAVGLMTFDPETQEQCRFMGCYDGFKPVKWRLPAFKRTYKDESGNFQIDPSEVSGYYCTSDLSKVYALDNIGILEKIENSSSSGKILLAPFDPTVIGFEVSSNASRCNSSYKNNYQDGILISSNNIVKNNPPAKNDVCLGVTGEITAKYVNAITPEYIIPSDLVFQCTASSVVSTDRTKCLYLQKNLYEKSKSTYPDCQSLANYYNSDARLAVNKSTILIADPDILNKCLSWTAGSELIKSVAVPFATYNCGGTVDSMNVGDKLCLKHLKSKRESFGDCYIPNGKGFYDRAAARCKVASCHNGFEISASGLACLDKTRSCRGDLSQGYLGQLQVGFTGEPISVCMKEKSGISETYKVISSLGLAKDGKTYIYYEAGFPSEGVSNNYEAALEAVKASTLYPLGGVCSGVKVTRSGSSLFPKVTETPYVGNYGIQFPSILNDTGWKVECIDSTYFKYDNTSNGLFSTYVNIYGHLINYVSADIRSASVTYLYDTYRSIVDLNALTDYKKYISSQNNGQYIAKGGSASAAASLYSPSGPESGVLGIKSGSKTIIACSSNDSTYKLVRDRFGYYSCKYFPSNDDKVIPDPPAFFPCQVSTSARVDDVYARGYLTRSECLITTCNRPDPFYSGGGTRNAVFIDAVPLPGTNSGGRTYNICRTAPIHETLLVMNNDYTLVRKSDSLYNCDVKSQKTGEVLQSNVTCKNLLTTGAYKDYDGGFVPGLSNFNKSQTNFDEIDAVIKSFQ